MIAGYVVVREGRDPLKPSGLFSVGLRLRVLGRGGKKWALSSEDGSKSLTYDNLGNAVSKTLDRLVRQPIGGGVRFAVKDGPTVVRSVVVRVVDWTPEPADTNGSDQVDLYVGCLNALWGDKWRSAGALVCKKTAGTNTWSDHAWGQAQDLFASWDVMDEIAEWTVANYKELNVNYVILRDKIWERSTKKWGNYSGVYHNHVHTSFVHDGAGLPPCAR